MVFRLPDNEIVFPDPSLANDDGFLAVGGDLSEERLILAYHNGIFPWFIQDGLICWYSPHQRCVIYPDRIKVSKSMKQTLRNGGFKVSTNNAFRQVIINCARIPRKDEPGTWISRKMQEAYINLHKLGWAHSVEVRKDSKLVGGIYGVAINRVFCGESMFSAVNNASKVALISLCQQSGFELIDCQMPNNHLLSLGAEMIDRETYMELLNNHQ